MNPNALLQEFLIKVCVILCLQKHYFKGFTVKDGIKIVLLIRSRNKLKQKETYAKRSLSGF